MCRATNSTAIEAIQTLLGVLCYRPLSGNECIQELCKLSAGLLLASAQQIVSNYRLARCLRNDIATKILAVQGIPTSLLND